MIRTWDEREREGANSIENRRIEFKDHICFRYLFFENVYYSMSFTIFIKSLNNILNMFSSDIQTHINFIKQN